MVGGGLTILTEDSRRGSGAARPRGETTPPFSRETRKQGGRKVYTITDEGRAYLEEHRGEIDQIRARLGSLWGQESWAEIRELMGEMAGFVRTLS